jgi:hypothetical protein
VAVFSILPSPGFFSGALPIMQIRIVRNVGRYTIGQRLTLARYYAEQLIAIGIAQEDYGDDSSGNEPPRKKRQYRRRDLTAERP